MQPHVNMGINFRKRFPLHAMSKEKARNVIQTQMRRSIREMRKGITPKEIGRSLLKELGKFLR
jgi:hypothetical protein